MPFTFLAHQAPVLPLKLWRPRWFSGAGLAIGSMAPDFDKFVDGANASRYGHSLAAQVTYCLPFSLAIYWLLTRLAAPALTRFLPSLGALRLRDYAAAMTTSRPRGAEWLAVAASILVGSVSHVIFDGFTHGDRRVVALFPFLANRPVAIGGRFYMLSAVLQVAATLVGGAFTLALLWVIGRQRRVLAWAGLDPACVPARAERSRTAAAYWLTVALLTIAGSAFIVLVRVAAAGGTEVPGLGYSVILRLPVVGFAALCVAAVTSAGTARSEPVAPAPNEPRERHQTPSRP